MKVGDIVSTKITIQPNVVEEERSKSAWTPAEIHLRALEIHIERAGIQRLALDTDQQADTNLKKSSQAAKENQGHPGDIETPERSATVKPPSLFDWYRILRTQHHWTVFQAIRLALWLAR
jgi:hypothetical protein